MDRFLHDRRAAAVGWSLAVSILLAVAGCEKESLDPETFRLSDFGKFSSLVGGVSEAMLIENFERDPRFEGLFVEGAAPPIAERSKYGPPMWFELAADPEISGDTATLTVNVLKVDENANREVVGETKWTGVKVDGEWLLKDVPLP